MLRRAGFFRELPHGDPAGPSLLTERDKLPDRAEVAQYLEAGALVVASPGVGFDVLSAQHDVIGPIHLLTDGEWLWPADLAYYVRTYDVAIPQDFLERIRSEAYRPRELDENDIRGLTY